MSESSEDLVLMISDIERLEFGGTRNDDGTIDGLGKRLHDWPERLVIVDVIFRLEESDDQGEAGSNRTQAWYVPAE